MTKQLYIQEITNNLAAFDTRKLKQALDFIKYMKYQDVLDPTLEFLSNEIFTKKIQLGIEEKKKGEVLSWNSVR
jgi:hypothetical protein